MDFNKIKRYLHRHNYNILYIFTGIFGFVVLLLHKIKKKKVGILQFVLTCSVISTQYYYLVMLFSKNYLGSSTTEI